MLDFGWSELFVIIAVAVIFIGPNELPALMVALGRLVRRLNYIKFAISQQFEDIMHEADVDDLRNSVNFEAKKHEEAIEGGEFDEAGADEAYAVLPELLEGKDHD